MKDFRTVTLADQVFERLESDIIQGVYPRGEVLTELKLVEQLNVSRTPIREALRRLEQEHLIADTGKGSVVLGTWKYIYNEYHYDCSTWRNFINRW